MKICTIDGCDKRHFGLGYCAKHYARFRKYGDTTTVMHMLGQRKSNNPLHGTYHNMKQRCYNPNDKIYKHYGGRGISVCDRWLGEEGFRNFCEDMGERPNGLSLDRINNDGNYNPDNCRRATQHQQHSNKRGNNKNVGVSWHNTSKKWRACITINRKKIHLGSYNKYEDAVKKRKNAEELYLNK